MKKIARIWFGETLRSNADEYLAYVTETGVKGLRETEGNQGVLVLRKLGEQTAKFAVISFWDAIESIRRFAGGDINKAVYYPEDRRFLFKMEPELEHFEVSVAEGVRIGDV
jgi:heme-degrading monooxygenase HmoA